MVRWRKGENACGADESPDVLDGGPHLFPVIASLTDGPGEDHQCVIGMTAERAYILGIFCLIGLLVCLDNRFLRMLVREQIRNDDPAGREDHALGGNTRGLCILDVGKAVALENGNGHADLAGVGEGLLGTDSAWVEIGRAVEVPRSTFASFFGPKPPPVNERRLADQWTPQYPWIWSAGVLAGLLGLSLWTLSMRVKSLDRLR